MCLYLFVFRRSFTPINDVVVHEDDDNNYYNDHETFITENNFGDNCGAEDVANDIEIIAIDPNQEYSSDEDGNEDEEEDYMSVFEEEHSDACESSSLITIENVKAALQASGHSRVARRSLSVPHSPIRYSMDFSGISFDDLDIHSHFPDLMTHNMRPLPIVDSVDAVKTFDLASYITQDDNFEVISPSKVLPITTNAIVQEPYVNNNLNTNSVNNSLPISMHNNNREIPQEQEPSSRKRRACVLSSKRMHYQVPSSEDEDDDDEEHDHHESSTDNANIFHSDNHSEKEEIERVDNTKVDPTWMPFKVKTPKPAKLANAKTQKVKEPKMKKAKSAPVVKSTSKGTQVKGCLQQQKNLLKVCKNTNPSRTRMLNASGQLSKDKIHKIVSSFLFILF